MTHKTHVLSASISCLLSAATAMAAPANDNFAAAIALPGDTGTLSGNNNIDATFEVDEPTCVYPEATNTVWFKWTCTTPGSWTIDTTGSVNASAGEWDACIAVYTGASLGTLTKVVEQDDGPEPQETLRLAVTPGVYYVQLGGYPTLNPEVANDIKLTWSWTAHPTTYGYDFNHLNRGTGGFGSEAILGGQDNWLWKSGGNFRVVGTVGSGLYAAAGPIGGSATGVVYRPNNATWEFTIVDGDQFTIGWVGRVQNNRDMELGLGNAGGNPVFTFGNRAAVWRFQDANGTATTSSDQAPTGTSTYPTLNIAVNLAANGGDGSASCFIGDSPVVGLQNLSMGLLTAGLDGSDMQSLYLRSRDNSDFDNIVITKTQTTNDTDGDGLPDAWEQLYFGSNTAANPNDNPDDDRLTNLEELQLGTHPTKRDTNEDGVDDGTAVALTSLGFSPTQDSSSLLALIQAERAGLGLALASELDDALQVGRDEVLNDPNSFDLYNASQMRALALGRPVLQRNPTTGKFTLKLGIRKSTGLRLWETLPITEPDVSVNNNDVLVEFASPDGAAFFQVEGKE